MTDLIRHLDRLEHKHTAKGEALQEAWAERVRAVLTSAEYREWLGYFERSHAAGQWQEATPEEGAALVKAEQDDDAWARMLAWIRHEAHNLLAPGPSFKTWAKAAERERAQRREMMR